MDWTKIERLVEKYYDGQTTLEEEQLLKTAFQSADIPTHLENEAQLFGFFKHAAVETASTQTEIAVTPKIKLWPKLASLAAVMLLLITLTIKSSPKVYGDINNQNIYDKELAFQESKKALLLVSEKMNSRSEALVLLKLFNRK